MTLSSKLAWTAALLAVLLPATLPAQGSSDRIRRLRERLLERDRDRDGGEVPASEMVLPEVAGPGVGGVLPGAGAAGDLSLTEPPQPPPEAPPAEAAPSEEPEDVSPGQEIASEDLDEAERAAMKSIAAKVVDDAELLAKGGFRLRKSTEPVPLVYPTGADEAEFILEVQSQIAMPGSKVPVPVRRLMVIQATRKPQAEGRLEWAYHVVQAKTSKLVTEGGKTQLVLVDDESLAGAFVPLDTDTRGVPSRKDQTVTQSRYIEWLRMLLPSRPKRPGYGWRTLSPRSLGSRKEAVGGVYLLHRLVDLGGKRDVAVIRGRFQGRGAEMGESQFRSVGQDRVLFDLDRGQVLYREFRMEGSYLRNTPQGPQPYQARIKGLVMEKSLLEGLSVEDRKARLNAATALFGE